MRILSGLNNFVWAFKKKRLLFKEAVKNNNAEAAFEYINKYGDDNSKRSKKMLEILFDHWQDSPVPGVGLLAAYVEGVEKLAQKYDRLPQFKKTIKSYIDLHKSEFWKVHFWFGKFLEVVNRNIDDGDNIEFCLKDLNSRYSHDICHADSNEEISKQITFLVNSKFKIKDLEEIVLTRVNKLNVYIKHFYINGDFKSWKEHTQELDDDISAVLKSNKFSDKTKKEIIDIAINTRGLANSHELIIKNAKQYGISLADVNKCKNKAVDFNVVRDNMSKSSNSNRYVSESSSINVGYYEALQVLEAQRESEFKHYGDCNMSITDAEVERMRNRILQRKYNEELNKIRSNATRRNRTRSK